MINGNELIDDRAITEQSADRLNHHQIALQLHRLIRGAKTPANIALYGRWGAGKTSLSNLLREECKADGGLNFVRFDAFKWVETPLRRHFLSQVARELGIKGRQFGSGLYEQVVRIDISFPSTRASWFVFAALIMLLVGSIALSVNYSGTQGSDVISTVLQSLGFTSLTALVAAALFFLAGKTLPVKRTIEAPSSDEQFEVLFYELVRRAKGDRLVIFVDELDRCSAEEVVETLETIKTFLDIPRCVFIVAADRGVLESALSRRARQVKPSGVHPYYDSASEYLDKMFHYHLELPPLRPHRLSSFALALTTDCGGVWDRVERKLIIPVLIPTSVRSPRRVKTLLNNFVLTYRLLEERARKGFLDENLLARSAEVAKLVAIRTEFPTFAGDLELDHRMSEWVPTLAESDGQEEYLPETMTERVRDLVRNYASFASSSSEQMSSTEDVDTRSRETLATAEGLHRQQLVNYLQKTLSIPGPRPDLIFLESTGAGFGLEPSFASELENAAVDGRRARVRTLLEDLPRADWIASIQMLADRTRHAALGVEGANAVGSLLSAMKETPDTSVETVANEVANALAAHRRHYTLDELDLVGAFRIGLMSRRPAGETLMDEVLSRDETRTNGELGLRVLGAYSRLNENQRKVAAEIAVTWLIDREMASEAWSTLTALEPQVQLQLLDRHRDALRSAYTELPEEVRSELFKIGADCLKSESLFAELEILLTIGLRIESADLADLTVGYLTDLEVVRDGKLAREVLSTAAHRELREWPKWLDPLACTESLQGLSLDEGAPLVERLGKALMVPAQIDSQTFRDAARAFQTLIASGLSVSLQPLSASVLNVLNDSPQSHTSLASDAGLFRSVKALCEIKLVLPVDVIPAMRRRLGGYLNFGPPQVPDVEKLKALIDEWGQWIATNGKEEDVDLLLADIAECTWLRSPSEEDLLLRIACLAVERDIEVRLPISARDLKGMYESCRSSDPQLVEDTVGVWIESMSPSNKEVWTVLETAVYGHFSQRLSRSVRRYSEKLTPAERFDFLKPALAGLLDRGPSLRFLKAALLDSCDENSVADILERQYNSATNNDQRERIIEVYDAASLSEDSVRRELINTILLPAIDENKGSLRHVLSHMELLRDPPHGTKGKIKEALSRQLAEYPRYSKSYGKQLSEMGLLERVGFFRKIWRN